ncbi:MAG: hypothetical protein JWM34_1117 [Ilumatobacteraceae bacterium]|nr:hypothetical protein [Ilumatobacteraceae bacterium]
MNTRRQQRIERRTARLHRRAVRGHAAVICLEELAVIADRRRSECTTRTVDNLA